MTDSVASHIEVNEELTLATEEAKRIMRERRHLQDVTKAREADSVRSQQARFQGVVATNRLRDIALSQMQELMYLTRELDRWRRKSFPAVVRTAHAPPAMAGPVINKQRS